MQSTISASNSPVVNTLCKSEIVTVCVAPSPSAACFHCEVPVSMGVAVNHLAPFLTSIALKAGRAWRRPCTLTAGQHTVHPPPACPWLLLLLLLWHQHQVIAVKSLYCTVTYCVVHQ